jgi:hypothetical protein
MLQPAGNGEIPPSSRQGRPGNGTAFFCRKNKARSILTNTLPGFKKIHGGELLSFQRGLINI